MVVDAIVLAGAPNKPPLTEVSSEPWEALIPIVGKPMVQWVIDALDQSTSVDRVIVVGPTEALRSRVTGHKLVFAECGRSILDNVKIGSKLATPGRRVLVVTGDIPLLTPQAIDDFVSRCGDQSLHVYYSIVRKDCIDRRFDDIERTYVTIHDGTFTGGNILLLDPRIFEDFSEVIDEAIALRKKPLKLLMLLGPGCILRFIFHRLRIVDVERRVANKLGIRGKGVESGFPEVGIDVDKPQDFNRALEILKARD